MIESKKDQGSQASAQPAKSNRASPPSIEVDNEGNLASDSIAMEAIQTAAVRLRGHIVRTPTIRNIKLDRWARGELYFKAENLQHVSAFKARGAFNFIAGMEPNLRSRGIVTYSSGNHGQAVAWAARHFGISAHIAMPIDAPAIKRNAIISMGASVLDGGLDFEYRKQVAEDFAKRFDHVIVPPFDHLDIIAGQGTATLELLEDCYRDTPDADLDAIFVPVGGGGAIAGACLARQSLQASHAGRSRATAIYSVEPVGCDSMAQSLRAAHRVIVPSGESIADGLRPNCVGHLNFAIAKNSLSGSYCVNDHQIGEAWMALLLLGKLLVEPSAATAFAGAIAYLQEHVSSSGAVPRVGVMLTGGNIDPLRIKQLIDRHTDLHFDQIV